MKKCMLMAMLCIAHIASAGNMTQTKSMSLEEIKARPSQQIYSIALQLRQQGNSPVAVELLETAGAKGNHEAYYELARMYKKGMGVPKDMAKSKQYGKKAVELEDRAMESASFDTGF